MPRSSALKAGHLIPPRPDRLTTLPLTSYNSALRDRRLLNRCELNLYSQSVYLAQTFYQSERSYQQLWQKFTPLHDRILVRRVGRGRPPLVAALLSQTQPRTSRRRRSHLRRQRSAPTTKAKSFPLASKRATCILFAKYAGTEIKLDGDRLHHHEGRRSPGHP